MRQWLKQGAPKTVDAIVRSLTGPAPLGPAGMSRSHQGKIEDLPHRSDRVVAVRVQLRTSEGWHLKAAIHKAKKLPIH
ncbi:MAG: hypothetical protein Q8P41_15800 [Pseudomonadota bacterium]|nr:hypothetical protein [Pseudomonadota bacterium]